MGLNLRIGTPGFDWSTAAMSDLLNIQPSELKFPFELKKQISCNLKFVNDTQSYVAFKVKTTSPKKYCVRPNTGVVLPKSKMEILVTMQAQREAPADMQCKDKFLVQTVVAPDGFSANDVQQEMFSKESGKEIYETKLRVVYVSPEAAFASREDRYSGAASNDDVKFSFEDDGMKDTGELKAKIQEVNAKLATVSEERNAAVLLSQRLQQELANMATSTKVPDSGLKQQVGYSFLLVFLVGLLGVLLGYFISS